MQEINILDNENIKLCGIPYARHGRNCRLPGHVMEKLSPPAQVQALQTAGGQSAL